LFCCSEVLSSVAHITLIRPDMAGGDVRQRKGVASRQQVSAGADAGGASSGTGTKIAVGIGAALLAAGAVVTGPYLYNAIQKHQQRHDPVRSLAQEDEDVLVGILNSTASKYRGFSQEANESSSTTSSSSIDPVIYSYRIVKRYRHDPQAFTQGLLWLNGSLYESTGMYGRSVVREVQLTEPESEQSGSAETGSFRVLREVPNDPSEFGEGLVHVGNGELLQLLWRVGRGNRFQASAGEAGSLSRQPEGFNTPLQDGWGFEFDGKSLLVTDSGSDVYFLDPKTFAQQRKVRVKDADRVVEMVNELELIDGELWANIFGTECIARVEPSTGAVVGWVDLTGILNRKKAAAAARKKGLDPPDILNGIAFDSSSRRLFVTGKLWPRLYEIELVKSNISLTEARNRCIPKVNIFHQQR